MMKAKDTLKTSAKYFDAETLGASLRELAVDIMPSDTTDFVSRWFKSKTSEADLVIWTDGQKRIIKYQLSFYGQVVDWSPLHGTRTGFIVEEEIAALEGDDSDFDGLDGDEDFAVLMAMAGVESGEVKEIVRFDETPQKAVVENAVRLISRIPEISTDDRDLLVFNLQKSPKLHKNARERAIKTWGSSLDQIDSTQRPSFWRRLRGWVLGG